MGSHEKVANGREYNLVLKFFEDPFDYRIKKLYMGRGKSGENNCQAISVVEARDGGGGARRWWSQEVFWRANETWQWIGCGE